MVTLDVESTITCIGVAAVFTGWTIVTTSLHVLHMYLKHDYIYCLQWCYMASKHCITILALPNNNEV